MADRSLRGWGTAAVLAALPAPGPAQTVDAMMAKGRTLTAPCVTDRQNEIVVCGRAETTSRYRLPLPDEREANPQPSSGGPGQIEMLKTPGACAPVGPRRCTKREALTQGLGGGRNPLDQAIRLADRLLNGD